MDDQASAIEEEYILLDLEEVFHGGAIPTNCPYTLSGLDTLNPILTLGNGLKLIGEYEDTVGSCIVFSESDEPTETIRDPVFPLDIVDPTKQPIQKVVKSVCSLQKKLKFRVMSDKDQPLTGATATQ
ncbi:uncharacterized protein LOC112346792 isoform X2 [Selaginella moellendorffii]|uniref:uncharacterized protein LOC112346792 isoform X2 n=1 Tax=Selaginella moellendorffii TaxID=88036 RepID=UPI000D1CD15B|nr:uncharacterized protein LOC112346792 isoform X2 [Selaginella moellendorffii]|eukprot:XP_024532210.1 uncharacterized protein LOC112346792 isoform X2 [Selaginella moellendorffii]